MIPKPWVRARPRGAAKWKSEGRPLAWAVRRRLRPGAGFRSGASGVCQTWPLAACSAAGRAFPTRPSTGTRARSSELHCNATRHRCYDAVSLLSSLAHLPNASQATKPCPLQAAHGASRRCDTRRGGNRSQLTSRSSRNSPTSRSRASTSMSTATTSCTGRSSSTGPWVSARRRGTDGTERLGLRRRRVHRRRRVRHRLPVQGADGELSGTQSSADETQITFATKMYHPNIDSDGK